MNINVNRGGKTVRSTFTYNYCGLRQKDCDSAGNPVFRQRIFPSYWVLHVWYSNCWRQRTSTSPTSGCRCHRISWRARWTLEMAHQSWPTPSYCQSLARELGPAVVSRRRLSVLHWSSQLHKPSSAYRTMSSNSCPWKRAGANIMRTRVQMWWGKIPEVEVELSEPSPCSLRRCICFPFLKSGPSSKTPVLLCSCARLNSISIEEQLY